MSLAGATAAPVAASGSVGSGESAASSATATTTATTLGEGSWRSSLAAEYQADPNIAKHATLESLVKSHLEQGKLVGGSVRIPGDNATSSEVEAFQTKLGRPAKPEDYGFKPLENLPAGATYDNETDKWFSTIAHKAGLSSKQANTLREGYISRQMETIQKTLADQATTEATNKVALESLRMKYGSEWPQLVEGANMLLGKFFPPEFVKSLAATGLGNNPGFISGMTELAKAVKPHGVFGASSNPAGNFSSSPGGAVAELDRLKADPEFMKALLTASHPKHDEAIKRQTDLFKAAYPNPEGHRTF